MASLQATALKYAVRWPVLARYFGQLCYVLGAANLVPLAVALLWGEFHVAWRYGAVVAILAVLAVGLSRVPASGRVQLNEGLVLVTAMFLVGPLFASFPLMASGLDFVEAFFEAVSGVTTTGLTTLESVEEMSPAFLFSRAWMQWYGGLGIAVLSLAVIVQPGTAAMSMAPTDVRQDDLVGGTKAHARSALQVYGLLTAVGVVVLWLLGMAPFQALLYTLAAVSTGGFAPRDASLGEVGWLIPAGVLLFCVLGALPFSAYYRLWRRRIPSRQDFIQIAALGASLLLTVLLLSLSIRISRAMTPDEMVKHVPAMAVSAQTTSGFSTLDPAQLDGASKLVLMVSMMIGGGIGSTAGGVKIWRVVILLSLLHGLILRACLPPHAELAPRLLGERLETREIHRALLLIALFLGVVAASWFPFLLAGYPPMDALFEVVSATGTVGLSAGVTDAALPTALKMILCADMLLGRLEIVAWLVMFYPGTWMGRRMQSR